MFVVATRLSIGLALLLHTGSVYPNTASSDTLPAWPVFEMVMPFSMAALTLPNPSLMPDMGVGFGTIASLAIYPKKGRPFALELQARQTRYGSEWVEFDIELSDGTMDRTSIHNVSRAEQLLLGFKMFDPGSSSAFKPFITPQLGYASFRSRMRLYDIGRVCSPAERRRINQSGSMAIGGEVGLELSKSSWHNIGLNGFAIILSMNYIHSLSELEHVDVRNMVEDRPIHTSHNGGSASDVMAAFINVTSDELHYHKIAELHRTPLSMLGFNLGVIWRF